MMKRFSYMLAVAIVATIFAGCQTAKQPGRTNEQNTTVKDDASLTVDQSVRSASSAIALPSIPVGGYDTNAMAQLKELVALQVTLNAKTNGEKDRTYGDVFTQNQMIETSGSEANTATATSIPSTSVPLNVAWGAGAIGGGGGGGSGTGLVSESAYKQFLNWWNKGGSNDTANATKEAKADCPSGVCSDTATGSTCTTGTCPTAK